MYKKDFRSIKKKINKASNIFIIGHKNIDLDSFAASLGIYTYSVKNGKESSIIIDDKKFEIGVRKAIAYYKQKINIITSSEISKINRKSLLIVLDTNKSYLLTNPELINMFNNVMVIDHHSLSIDSIDGSSAVIINDIHSSSASEMIVKFLSFYDYAITSDIATLLLSGIVLDTNNFIIKTSADTYYAAYYLSKFGASSREVQFFMKRNIKEYQEMQKVITNVKIIGNIALAKGCENKKYKREDLAKIADTILLFDNIEASFAVGRITDGIGVSARSMGNIDVGSFLEQFNGGGDMYEAATIISDLCFEGVFNLIIDKLKEL